MVPVESHQLGLLSKVWELAAFSCLTHPPTLPTGLSPLQPIKATTPKAVSCLQLCMPTSPLETLFDSPRHLSFVPVTAAGFLDFSPT